MAALTQELKEAGNRDYTIQLFPDGNHDERETSNVMLDNEQLRYLRRHVLGYFDTPLGWGLSHVPKVRLRGFSERNFRQMHKPIAGKIETAISISGCPTTEPLKPQCHHLVYLRRTTQFNM